MTISMWMSDELLLPLTKRGYGVFEVETIWRPAAHTEIDWLLNCFFWMHTSILVIIIIIILLIIIRSSSSSSSSIFIWCNYYTVVAEWMFLSADLLFCRRIVQLPHQVEGFYSRVTHVVDPHNHARARLRGQHHSRCNVTGIPLCV